MNKSTWIKYVLFTHSGPMAAAKLSFCVSETLKDWSDVLDTKYICTNIIDDLITLAV